MKYLDYFEAGYLVEAAFRYHLGRATAHTTDFIAALALAWPELPEHTQTIIREELRAALSAHVAHEHADLHDPTGPTGKVLPLRGAWLAVERAWTEFGYPGGDGKKNGPSQEKA